MEGLAQLLDMTEGSLAAFSLVFMRIGAIMFLLPAFGEQMIPMRVRLGLTFAFSAVLWPMLTPQDVTPPDRPFFLMMIIEAGIGLLIGFSLRFMVFALQFAGSVASQVSSLAQLFGANAASTPMPVVGNILMVSGVTLAVVNGLHVKAVSTMLASYDLLPMGLGVSGRDVAAWGTARFAKAFALGFSMAAPFVLAAFAYNVALGAINRAMPQLMVALIGAPAILAVTLFMLMLSAPIILVFWNYHLDLVLSEPLGLPR